MKILDVPQVGKLGTTVTFRGRNGLIRRALVIPTNPNTLPQQAVRSTFTLNAQRFDALTEAQQDAWNTAAAGVQSKATLGQSGPLTGLQLFVKINSALAIIGETPVDVPPISPVFTPNPTGALVITNTADVIALKLACPGTPANNTVVRASAPQHSGTRRSQSLRVLGILPAPAQGSCDLTNLYVARYGVPPVNSRIYVATNEILDGWEAPLTMASGLVPASS